MAVLPIPSAADFLDNVHDDIKIIDIRRDLDDHMRLHMLGDRAEYIHMHFGERPVTWYEFSQYLIACGALNEKPKDGQQTPTVFVAGAGAAMGAAACALARGMWPKSEMSYLVSMMIGGSAAITYNAWQQSGKGGDSVKRCIDAYENYLDHFQQAKTEGQPAPRLREELVSGKVSDVGMGR